MTVTNSATCVSVLVSVGWSRFMRGVHAQESVQHSLQLHASSSGVPVRPRNTSARACLFECHGPFLSACKQNIDCESAIMGVAGDGLGHGVQSKVPTLATLISPKPKGEPVGQGNSHSCLCPWRGFLNTRLPGDTIITILIALIQSTVSITTKSWKWRKSRLGTNMHG